jgi:hypothetical protein
MLTRFAYALTGICLALHLASIAAAQTAPLAFTDSFSDGSATDGNPVSWIGGSVVNQDLRLSGSGITQAFVAGSEAFADVSIRMTARALVNSLSNPNDFHSLGPIARSTAGGQSYFWGAITTNSYIAVGTWNPYADSILYLPQLDSTTMDVDLQFDVVGNQLSLWAWSDDEGIRKPASPQITWQSPLALNRGSIGLYHNARGGNGYVDYRSVTVVPEPATGALLLVGAVACRLVRYCRRASQLRTRRITG